MAALQCHGWWYRRYRSFALTQVSACSALGSRAVHLKQSIVVGNISSAVSRITYASAIYIHALSATILSQGCRQNHRECSGIAVRDVKASFEVVFTSWTRKSVSFDVVAVRLVDGGSGFAATLIVSGLTPGDDPWVAIIVRRARSLFFGLLRCKLGNFLYCYIRYKKMPTTMRKNTTLEEKVMNKPSIYCYTTSSSRY